VKFLLILIINQCNSLDQQQSSLFTSQHTPQLDDITMVPSIITPPPSCAGGPISPASICSDHVDIADQADGRWIRLPEALFSSVMAVEPDINPMYQTSKALSDAWLKE
jgi:hypothetical protein